MLRRMRAARRGNVLVLSCFLLIVMVAFVALAVDIGYLYTVRNELQRSADAAAIAAAWELVEDDTMDSSFNVDSITENARETAELFASLNRVGNAEPGLAGDDVEIGYMANPSNPSDPLVAVPPGLLPNAVHVRVQRTELQNGEVPLFFARAIGFDKAAAEGQATAAFVNTFVGFQAPADGSNLGMLPFALDISTWTALSSTGTDSWRYNPETKTVTAGSDGIKEVNLYPQGTGSPGNRGTVDIGGSNNSTSDISRQINDGVSPADLEALTNSGRTLEFSPGGTLSLNGDTGISAAVKDDLNAIKGQPRIIPIFSSVAGPGNNAEYTIVKFVGVRVMEVKLTGSMSGKKVIIQPCNMIAKGGIPQPGATGTQYIYSPVWLVR